MWYHEFKPFEPESAPEEYIGFVYRIQDLDTNKKYIGKKLFWNRRKTKVKTKAGGTKTKYVTKESDWRSYYGSNAQLKEEVANYGPDPEAKKYYREILRLCKTKGECSYHEAKLQFEYDVLLRDDYYNGYIQCRINSKHIKKDEDDGE
mgnify:FL=1|jgi:hypothetical protein